MTYVIAAPCIDVLDRACVEECPVDCIYEGKRSLYIQPDECIDCGACEPACPVEAIFYEDDVPGQWFRHSADNALFFSHALPGQDKPLGSPRGAASVGTVGTDTPLVARYPKQDTHV
jgi:NAD-dependent dihydropyrimidine dehydrogenase PreA subunit